MSIFDKCDLMNYTFFIAKAVKRYPQKTFAIYTSGRESMPILYPELKHLTKKSNNSIKNRLVK